MIDRLRVYASFAEFEQAELARVTGASGVSCLATLIDASYSPAPQSPPASRAHMTACPAKPHVEEAPEKKRGVFPRVYASFAELERVEHRCLMTAIVATYTPLLEVSLRGTRTTGACPQSTAIVIASRAPQALSTSRRARPKVPCTRLSPARLRAEGVLEIGRVPDTGILYVQTQVKFYLLHETWA